MQLVCVIKAMFDLRLCTIRTPRKDNCKLNYPHVIWLLADHSGEVRF